MRQEAEGRRQEGLKDFFLFFYYYFIFDHLLTLIQVQITPEPSAKKGDQEALSLLKEACQPKEEYSTFAIIYILPHLNF